MRDINLTTAWLAILAGLITGTASGLFFHDESWMGGYGSWRRRDRCASATSRSSVRLS